LTIVDRRYYHQWSRKHIEWDFGDITNCCRRFCSAFFDASDIESAGLDGVDIEPWFSEVSSNLATYCSSSYSAKIVLYVQLVVAHVWDWNLYGPTCVLTWVDLQICWHQDLLASVIVLSFVLPIRAPFFSAYFPDSPRSYPPQASPRISFLKFAQQSR
jgi:hypothetical protein